MRTSSPGDEDPGGCTAPEERPDHSAATDAPWASNRSELFHADHLMPEREDGLTPVKWRGWVGLMDAWARAGMASNSARCLERFVWKAGDGLQHPVSLSATAKELGLHRRTVIKIKNVLCSIGIIGQVGRGRDGVVLTFAKYDDAIAMISANRSRWKQNRNRTRIGPHESRKDCGPSNTGSPNWIQGSRGARGVA